MKNFKVTKERRAVWDVELDLLSELKRVCKKHGIKYYAFGGTMLGAARHKGFIPWDDDIDLAMPRDDYQKLCAVAKKEFKEPYYFQTDYTDKLFRGHAQLCNSRTTAIIPCDLGHKYNQGIFIDIFPLDEYPKTQVEFERIRKKAFFMAGTMRNLYYHAGHAKFFTRRLVARIVVAFFGGKKRMYKKYEKMITRYNRCGNGVVGAATVNYGKKDDYMDASDADKLKEYAFDNTTIMMPTTYDKILKCHYGDYMKPAQVPTTHGEIYFSTTIPYDEFTKKVKTGEINPEEYFLK